MIEKWIINIFKVLDEIQDMIKGYKTTQSRFENKEN